MKTKIEIKSIFGDLIFEYEKEKVVIFLNFTKMKMEIKSTSHIVLPL